MSVSIYRHHVVLTNDGAVFFNMREFTESQFTDHAEIDPWAVLADRSQCDDHTAVTPSATSAHHPQTEQR